MYKLFLSFFLFGVCGSAVTAEKIFATGLKPAGSPTSLNTDYFRSKVTGAWSAPGTWESSTDNISWSNATLTPTNAAKTVTIRNGHTVTVSTNQTVDEVVIQSGGVLIQNMTSGILLTVNDGAGDDIIVESGGIFQLMNNTTNGPVFSGSATCNLNTGGMLRLSTTGLTFPNTGVNAVNYIYQHAAVLEYTETLAFASSGVTIFPNVNAVTIPVFRTTANLGNIGGGADFTVNGVYEAQGTITFTNAGQKIFRNGIIGNGKISSASGSGKFVINGLTASLGGADSLKLPTAGLDIGSNTIVTIVSNKTITGNINLMANTLVMLGNYNLNLTGDIAGGSATSHIVTDGSGKLVVTSIGVTARTFPVGATSNTYNPLVISNGSGLNYGVRVEAGINPPIAEPDRAINRTWFVTPIGGTPGTVNAVFFYNPGEGGVNFNYTTNLELGFFNATWNVIQTGLIPSGSYQVATTVNTLTNNSEAPLILGNLWSILTSDQSVTVDNFNAYHRAGNNHIQWKLTCTSTSEVLMELQRSNDAVNFNRLYGLRAPALRCLQPFVYEDIQPAAGQNYYRLKLTDGNGKTGFSRVISLNHIAADPEWVRISPNPVTAGFCDILVNAGRSGRVNLVLMDMQGRLLQQNKYPLLPGINTMRLNLNPVLKGMYQLLIMADTGESTTKRLVLQ